MITSRPSRKTRTLKKIKTGRYLLLLTILIGAGIIMLAPLYHIVLPKSNPLVDAYEEQLDKKVAFLDNSIEEVHRRYKEKEISGDQAYDLIFKELLPKREATIKSNKELLKEKEDAERVFGWKTWRSFWNGWGQRLPYVVFTFAFTFLFFAFDIKDKILYWSLIFFQLAAYTITIYQQVYSFWPAQDIPIDAYRWILFLTGLFCGTAVIMFMRNYVSRTETYKSIIRMLNGVLIKDVKPYVKDEIEYEEELMWPTLKNVRDAIKKG